MQLQIERGNSMKLDEDKLSTAIKSREIKRFRGFLQLFGEIYMDANRAFPANFGDFREY